MPFTDILLGREATSPAFLEGGLTASIITHTGFAKGTNVFSHGWDLKGGFFWGGQPLLIRKPKNKSILANWGKGHILLRGDGKQVPAACWLTGKKQVRD